MFDLGSFADWIRGLGTRQFVAVALVTGVVLFAPEGWLEVLGLSNLRGEYLPWFGGIFLLSASLALVNVFTELWGWGYGKFRERKIKQAGRERLHDLTPREKEILRGYIQNETRSLKIRVTNKTIHSLVQSGIIHQASKIGTLQGGHPFNIRKWAWEYLHDHPELLE